jgi:energy-converting hydrogenase Eha subunit H
MMGGTLISNCHAVKVETGRKTGQRFIMMMPMAQLTAAPIMSIAPSGERPTA